MNIDRLPPEILELIIDKSLPGSPTYLDDSQYAWRGTPKPDYPWHRAVAPYRLVSRAFYHAADALFYANVIIKLSARSRNNGTLLHPLDRLAKLIACERRSKYVRQLIVAVDNIDFSNYDSGSDITQFFNCGQPAGDNIQTSVDRVVEVLQVLFPKACAAFGGLKSLKFRGPVSKFDPDEEMQAPKAALVMQDLVAQGMANLASHDLEGLRLDLPCTHGISTALSSTTVPGLRHLRFLDLRATDDSGPWGVRFDYKRMINEDDEHRVFPFSELQKLLPNQLAVNQEFLRNINAFPNLRELKLTGSNYLNLELMRSAFVELRSLDLCRIWSSEASLINLINQIAPTVQAINLDEVELTEGTWEGVFESMLQCSQLEFLLVETCGYAPDAQSSQHRTVTFRPWESSTELESERQGDLCALGDLQRMVAQWRSCLDYEEHGRYDDHASSHVNMMPLAQWRANQLVAAE